MTLPSSWARALTASILMVLAVGPAAAQSLSLDRPDGDHQLGVRLDFGFPRDKEGDVTTEESFFRTEIYGQYVFRNYGVNLSLPFTRAIYRDDRQGYTALGNLELGGFGVFSTGRLGMVARFGISLPTADDTVRGFSANALASYGRLTDLVNTEPNTLAFRLSFSPVVQFGPVRLRGDLGFDLAFAVGDPLGAMPSDGVQTLFRGNIGLAIRAGMFTPVIEFVNVVALDDDIVPLGTVPVDRSTHVLTVGAFIDVGLIHPYFAFAIPLDDGTQDASGFVFTLGAEARL